MPNLISQMQNGLNPTTPAQPQALDASINQVRGMMQYLRAANNQEAAMKQLIENNPQFGQVVNMMKATRVVQKVWLEKWPRRRVLI